MEQVAVEQVAAEQVAVEQVASEQVAAVGVEVAMAAAVRMARQMLADGAFLDDGGGGARLPHSRFRT